MLKQRGAIYFGPGEWFALGSAITFAFANVLTRIASVEGDAIAGTVIRLAPVALFGVGMIILRRDRINPLKSSHPSFLGWHNIGWLIFYSLIIAPLAHVWLFLAFRYGGVLVAVPFFSTFPLIAALISVPFLGEVFDRRIGVGILASIIGIALLTYGQYTGTPVSSQWWLGAVFGLLTALTWAISGNLSGRLLRGGLDTYALIGITMTASVIVLTIILAATNRLNTLLEFSRQALWSLLLAGILLGAAQYFLFTAFALTTVAKASTIKTLDVGLATGAAVIFLGEVLNPAITLGVLLIVLGVMIVLIKDSNQSAENPLADV